MPMRRIQRTLMSAVLLGPTLLVGCATGTRYVEMMQMEGFVGTSPGKMYVEHIGGEDSSVFRKQLYKTLSQDGSFVVERYGIIPPEGPDSAANIPTLILSGTYHTHRSTQSSSEGSGKDEKKYIETTDIHEFEYLIRDAFTREELDANVARYEQVTKEEDRGDSFVESIINDAIKSGLDKLFGIESGHREELARIFATSLRVHHEKRRVSLFEDKDIPELKEGIEFLRKGDKATAIAKFQAGAENHPSSQSLHKAYFNLGVAFEYNHEFDKALVSLQLANEIAPQERYAAEIDYCQRFARHSGWLKRYWGPSY